MVTDHGIMVMAERAHFREFIPEILKSDIPVRACSQDQVINSRIVRASRQFFARH